MCLVCIFQWTVDFQKSSDHLLRGRPWQSLWTRKQQNCTNAIRPSKPMCARTFSALNASRCWAQTERGSRAQIAVHHAVRVSESRRGLRANKNQKLHHQSVTTRRRGNDNWTIHTRRLLSRHRSDAKWTL